MPSPVAAAAGGPEAAGPAADAAVAGVAAVAAAAAGIACRAGKVLPWQKGLVFQSFQESPIVKLYFGGTGIIFFLFLWV